MKKVIHLALVVVVLGAVGCYGSFSLTKKMWKWNGDVTKDKIGQEAIFLVANIIPVYGAVAFVDAIVLNSIEFWGGKNPVLAKASKTVTGGGQTAVMTYVPENNRLRIDIFENSRPKGWVIVAKDTAGNMFATDSNGAKLNSKTNNDNTVTLYKDDGSVVGNYSSNDLNKYWNN